LKRLGDAKDFLHTDRMDEYRQEAPDYDEDYIEEEAVDMPEIEEEESDYVTSTRISEAADLQKMFRQHPEIWIPYEEQVQEKLIPKGPDDPHHKTYPLLTRYEITKIISFRASQICNGAQPYILVPDGVTDAYQIAKLELQAKRLPFILKRPLPNGTYEFWRLADMMVVE
jgi:DNA-directed RNA polymerase I, II, and III subunit RPABC2